MEGKKFAVVIQEFCKKKEFTPEEASNFELYVTEVFRMVKGYMDSKEYDFISVKNFGTFFLKVWTVHSRMKVIEKNLVGYYGPRMNEGHYRAEKKKYDELAVVYERMTKDFFDRKLYFAERKLEMKEKGEERRLNQQYMMDIAMEDIEKDNEQQQIDIENETTGDTETSLGEQE